MRQLVGGQTPDKFRNGRKGSHAQVFVLFAGSKPAVSTSAPAPKPVVLPEPKGLVLPSSLRKWERQMLVTIPSIMEEEWGPLAEVFSAVEWWHAGKAVSSRKRRRVIFLEGKVILLSEVAQQEVKKIHSWIQHVHDNDDPGLSYDRRVWDVVPTGLVGPARLVWATTSLNQLNKKELEAVERFLSQGGNL